MCVSLFGSSFEFPVRFGLSDQRLCHIDACHLDTACSFYTIISLSDRILKDMIGQEGIKIVLAHAKII